MLDLNEIRAVTDKATPGPWSLQDDMDGGYDLLDSTHCNIGRVEFEEDAAFIASARQWVPALCDDVERLNCELSRIRSNASDDKKQLRKCIAEEKEDNAVLKRALEMACDLEAQDNCQDVSQVVDEYIRNAREEMKNAE